MPRFRYTARTHDGRVLKNKVFAEDFAKAQSILVEEGLDVTSLQKLESTNWFEKKALGYLEKKVKPEQVSRLIQRSIHRGEAVQLTGPARSVVCGWCESEHTYPTQEPNCSNCGGPLPTLGEDRGPKPPPAPRKLPEKFPKRLRWGNANYKVGLIFLIVGIPFIPLLGFGLIFSGLGYWLFNKAKQKIAGRLRALEHGQLAEGNITAVYRDTSVKINGRSPYKVEYQFTTRNGQLHVDFKTTWNANVLTHTIGEPQWVVYMPDDPSQSDLWPPLA